MLCQKCQKNKATIHFTKIINGCKTEFHLCGDCARKEGGLNFPFEPQFSMQNILTGLLNLQEVNNPIEYKNKIQCPNCGLTYTQFCQVGRFGCSECYSTFNERLSPLLRRIHGSDVHTGKAPQKIAGGVRLKKEIERLRQELQQCVTDEKYEKAARLRDKVKELEKKLEGES